MIPFIVYAFALWGVVALLIVIYGIFEIGRSKKPLPTGDRSAAREAQDTV